MLLMVQTRMKSAANSGMRMGNSWWHSICAESALLYLNLRDFNQPFL